MLVAGRPMRGLRPEELRLLEQFVAATTIPEPPASPAQPRSQQRAAEAIGVSSVTDFHSYTAKRQVGKSELLAELQDRAPAPAAAEVALPPPDRLAQQWRQDDRDAESVALRSAADTVRRVVGWVTAAAVLAGGAVLAVAAILEQSRGGLDSDANDTVAALFGSAVAFGLTSYLGYAVAGLVSARRAQRAVLTWLQGRDSGQVARGLPPRLLAPFLDNPPGRRLQMLGGFAGSVVGGILLVSGAVTLFVPAPAAAPAVLFPVDRRADSAAMAGVPRSSGDSGMAPRSAFAAASATAAGSARSTTSGSSTASSASKSPSREAARKASTASRCRTRSVAGRGSAPGRGVGPVRRRDRPQGVREAARELNVYVVTANNR